MLRSGLIKGDPACKPRRVRRELDASASLKLIYARGAPKIRLAHQVAGPAIPDPLASLRTPWRTRDARGASRGALARAYVCGFRPQLEQGDGKITVCPGRFGRVSPLH